jgi:hypothetical protein
MAKQPATAQADAQGDPAASALSRGRPSSYTPQIAQTILSRIALGEPLEAICREPGMPCSATVRDWVDPKSRPKIVPDSFSSEYARARAAGFDAIAAEALRIADTPQDGEEVITKPDGAQEFRRGDMLGHRKLQIDTRRWLLSKWDPKRYGDKLAFGGADDLPPVKVEMSDNEIARRIAFALHKGLAAQKDFP